MYTTEFLVLALHVSYLLPTIEPKFKLQVLLVCAKRHRIKVLTIRNDANGTLTLTRGAGLGQGARVIGELRGSGRDKSPDVSQNK